MKFPEWSLERLKELADAEPGGLMACSPELLAELKEIAKTDEQVANTLRRAGVALSPLDELHPSRNERWPVRAQ